jgi:hypothetical protein
MIFRTTSLAALGLALMSSAALAQPADDPANDQGRFSNAPPAQLNGPADRSGDNDRPDDRAPPQRQAQGGNSSRDLFCRRDAAARTGYVTPDQAASHEQASGSVGGTLLGAVAGAAIGSASGHAGAGALIGAGAGLIAGTAIGQDNALRAARDVEQDYAAAYYACMNEARDEGEDYAQAPPPPRYAPPRYAYDYYGPPVYYGPYPYYYGPAYYGPSISLGFGFGGYHGFGGFREGGRGFRHR